MSQTFEQVLGRRAILKGAAASVPLLVLGQAGAQTGSSLGFIPIGPSSEDKIVVSPGYSVSVVLRWGAPLTNDAPDFDLFNQSAEAQARQFGYNCDYVGFFPLAAPSLGHSFLGLLAVNHETTAGALMFPNYVSTAPTRQQVDVELAAHGVSIVEVRRVGSAWEYVQGSHFNRRLTGETEMRITGPAAGEDLMRTSYDPTGTLVRGTLNNCAGGKTPWGTLLTAEENFSGYFANRESLPDGEVRAIHRRLNVASGATSRRWERFHDRFDVVKEPHEPFRFGWVVEVDPYDPSFVPRKRTALGRFKHEGATTTLAPDGRLAAYMGDDERFEFIYKFVSAGKYNPDQREANFNLLDEGILFVARFHPDGTGAWIPLLFGFGPLTAANGFRSQGDVLIKTRLAADAVGGTRMDRPEDVETNPVNRRVYVALTNNTQRATTNTDNANPRVNNRHGHILEITESGNDPAATRFTWEIFMLCGDPNNPADRPTFFAGFDTRLVSAISNPDNFAFDQRGNLWIATDGQPGTLRSNDGLFAVPTEGPERGYLRQFMSVPAGGEMCGPEFSPDDTTLFCSIQHPGSGGVLFTRVVSNWPDGTQPPKPSVLAVVKNPGSSSPIIGR